VREEFNPDDPEGGDHMNMHNTDAPFTVGEESDSDKEGKHPDELGHEQPWEQRTYDGRKDKSPDYGNDERAAWGPDGDKK